MKEGKKITVNYIDKQEFLNAIIAYKESCVKAAKKNKPKPRIPDQIGKFIMMIAENMAKRGNFSQYPAKDIMISEGIENCIRYFDNFDPNHQKKNPFGYFSQICFFAFNRRIQLEKDELYAKYKILQQSGILDDRMVHGNENNGSELVQDVELYDNIQEFIKKYEEAARKKKAKNTKLQKVKKVKLEQFIED